MAATASKDMTWVNYQDSSQCWNVSAFKGRKSQVEYGLMGIALPEYVPREHPIQHFLNTTPWFRRTYRGYGDIKGRGGC